MIDLIRSPDYLRYVLEFSILIPAGFFCLVPLRSFTRQPRSLIFMLAILEQIVMILLGAAICFRWSLESVPVLIASLMLFFPSLLFSVRLRVPKILFCMLNAVMMCEFSSLYTLCLTAPWELDNKLTFSPRSSMICLLIAFLMFLFFLPTLRTRLPALFMLHRLDRA